MSTPPHQELDPRSAAMWVADHLRSHGHVAYFAGGCVRDRLLGIEPSDFDVVTDARPKRIQELFRSAVGVGESFGVMLVRRGGQSVEVATFRSDGVYEDGRHPESVTFSDERSDAARRDFTINAIFEDPTTGTLIDYFDGAADLERRLLRAVGDPLERIREDHLRALRAVRFTARFDLEIDPPTAQAIRSTAGDLEGVSRERIGGELRRMLRDPSRVRAMMLLEELGMDAPVLLETTIRSIEQSGLHALGRGERPPIHALAAWNQDRGGPRTVERADHLRSALLLSNQEHRELISIFECCLAILDKWASLGVAGRKRLAVRQGFPVSLELVGVTDPSLAADVSRDLDELQASGLSPDPYLNGNDLIAENMEPGPRFKSILDAVYDAQLEGRIKNRDAAIALARSLL